MFPKNSAFHKDAETEEYEQNLRRHALRIKERNADPAADVKKAVDELAEEFRRAQPDK
jgi:hypothetical protein